VYTYTGATPSVTLRRLSGVVLGKVAGSILQLALAVKLLGFWWEKLPRISMDFSLHSVAIYMYINM